jgi:hypothetical protein
VVHFGVWTSGVDYRTQEFSLYPEFQRNKIILTYLIISNSFVHWKFLKAFKKIKIIFRVKRMYAPDAERMPLTHHFIK